MSFKRKRNNSEIANLPHYSLEEKCFSNAAFSSTPKKLVGRRRLLQQSKENTNPFLQNDFLEVKSIADIIEVNKNVEKNHTQASTNPFEIVRKPPKKKKRNEITEACFENPALNLHIPEKQFNPFEVKRDPVKEVLAHQKPQCFVNEALNLRMQDNSSTFNPFEIQRATPNKNTSNGIENLGIDDAISAKLEIKLPFRPTVGCRIDFKNMPLSALTPSKLLAEKLVFSPVATAAKLSVGSINEETSVDIGKELDRYQLELENSINEAKLRKNCMIDNSIQDKNQITSDQRLKFQHKLDEISEADENEQDNNVSELNKTNKSERQNIAVNATNYTEQITETDVKITIQLSPKSLSVNNTEDIEYTSESEVDDEIDFKAPAPFVRAYRRAASPKIRTSKESLNSQKSDNPTEFEEGKKTNVKSLIRRSIRKLMHKNDDNDVKKKTEEPRICTNILNGIRRSLRRKPVYQKEQLIKPDISIIDTSDRTMKLKSTELQTEYISIEQLTNEKKHTLRESLRQPSREIRHQLRKSLFHRNQEEYDFNK